jgi:hypothetical protein
MPSKSKKQLNFFRLVYAYKTGKLKKKDLNQKYAKKIIDTADNMSTKDIKDFLKIKNESMKNSTMYNMISWDQYISEEYLSEGLSSSENNEAKKIISKVLKAANYGKNRSFKYEPDPKEVIELEYDADPSWGGYSQKIEFSINFGDKMNNSIIFDILVEPSISYGRKSRDYMTPDDPDEIKDISFDVKEIYINIYEKDSRLRLGEEDEIEGDVKSDYKLDKEIEDYIEKTYTFSLI